MKWVVATIAALAVLGIVGAAAFVYSGIYNVAATRQHTAFVYWVMDTTLTRSIKLRAADIQAPDLADAAMIERGLIHYQAHCVQCHGAPGVPPQDFAKGMTPVPPNLLPSARDWTAAELFWVVKHGLRMTGMPGWDYRFADEEIWDVIAFMKRLPALSPVAYRELLFAVELAGEERAHPAPGG